MAYKLEILPLDEKNRARRERQMDLRRLLVTEGTVTA